MCKCHSYSKDYFLEENGGPTDFIPVEDGFLVGYLCYVCLTKANQPDFLILTKELEYTDSNCLKLYIRGRGIEPSPKFKRQVLEKYKKYKESEKNKVGCISCGRS